MAALAIQAHGHGLLQRHGFSCSHLPLHMNLSLAYPSTLRKCPVIPTALFWGERRSSKRVTPRPNREQFVISAEQVSQQAKQETARESDASPLTLTVSVVSSISLVSAEAWDLCALEAAGPEAVNPFVSHAFLSSLEDSKSAVAEEGWLPQHLVARDASNEVLGVVPLYLKSHSYGEYVFDHAWANAFFRYGGKYYPKLQCCVPFTPATGPRILVRTGSFREQVFDGLAKCMQQLTDQMKASSLHITFPERQEWERVAKMGYLQRMGVQYHWKNRNYSSFDDFLMDLKQSKRKNIRQERKKVVAQNLTLKRLRGDDIKPHHWDAFYTFYRNTTDNKWGQAYLTREFFHLMGERMGDRVLLVVAEDKGDLVAGALNLIGGDTLFGRNWGCKEYAHYHALHFEACYYQAIEAAIEMKLQTVEAGAQGEHKIQRGYLPTATYSAHYLPDPDFHDAIESFLLRENVQTKMALQYLQEASPFKDGIL
ncbi:hypothetical protein M758_1G114000 [Ceratodon purpureus]|uniref:Uncharacterized protein n=1 Tax=Ceratodon purpureus TaxID=3225 RepID=A0A8T0J4J4_CERPU|nr:hypothetical protein KC19_1G107300 [Ceratodon purpureus]KAG0629576.1 hypothetical protein M758_1G114000 [Ceratodon purpureus]